MRIVAFSDTHGLHQGLTVPDGDLLVFAGDMMNTGYHLDELTSFTKWFKALPHKHKVVIAGNHDRMLEYNKYAASYFPECHYLLDSGCEIEGFKFWGSPYTPEFCGWAFNVHRGQLYKHWDLIPEALDVLITHGPPYGILDGPRLGCPELSERLKVTQPTYHIFGHIHVGYGHHIKNHGFFSEDYYNVSICDEQYKPVNPCTVIDI